MSRQEADHLPEIASLLEITPMGRIGAPEEIAEVVAFLLSDAASFVTGVDLLADDGVVAAVEGPPRVPRVPAVRRCSAAPSGRREHPS